MVDDGMKKHILTFFGLLALILALVSPSLTMATPAMTPLPTIPKMPTMLPIAEQLGEQLQSLVNPPPPANPETDEINQEPAPTFGTRALNVVINITEIMNAQVRSFITNFAALPQLGDWVLQQANDPKLVARWMQLGSDIASTAGIAFLGALALEFLLYPARRVLRKRTQRDLITRIAVVCGLFLLRAIPILVFVSTSVMLLNQYETQKLPRFLVMNIVYAMALMRIAIALLRGIFSPKSEQLRFIPATTEQAKYGFRWLSAFVFVIIFGYFFNDVTRALRVPEQAVTAALNTLGLVLVAMGIAVIVQKRAFVANLVRGSLSAAQSDLSWFDYLRLWFARKWHTLAITYLIIGYIVAIAGSEYGIVLLLRGTVLTLLVIVAVRLLLREITRWEARSNKGTTTLYSIVKGVSLRFVVGILAVASELAAWGGNVSAMAASPLGQRILGSAFSIGLTLVILGLIYEVFSGAVDRHLTNRTPDGRFIEVNARSRTLLPMVRNALFILFISIISIVVLSEAGINIGPLLAGAGVVGVAVGFGSQTLVKDFLTGLFIVLENTIAIGDVVKIGDHSGTVEAMNMRTIRLRDMDGNLHILPFSEVSKIINQTRGFGNAVLKINVATDTDLDRAMDSIRAVGEEMQNDPDYKNIIMEPVNVMGVDCINDSSITLVASVRTISGSQWGVKRAFLLRLKKRFDKDGIQLPKNTASIRIEKEVEVPREVEIPEEEKNA
jgi:small conductance mechanosensitive channel